MIRPDAELNGETSFREWASLFSGKYFAMLVVYSDETGTGGIPESGEEPAPGVYGFLATPKMWDELRIKWKSELDRYKVPYFHFRELHPAMRKKENNPYHGWSNDYADDFIYDMATIASSGPIPFGGNISQKKTVGKYPNKFKMAGSYRKMFYNFFEDFKNIIDFHFPNETDKKTTFFFSDIQNENWIKILSQVHKDIRHHNPFIGEYAFIDPKSERGMPCQVADLLAYVARQNTSNMYDAGHILRLRLLDLIIGRHVFPEMPYMRALSDMTEGEWLELVADMRKAKREFETNNPKVDGRKPVYYPTKEHPFFKKLNLEYAKKLYESRNSI